MKKKRGRPPKKHLKANLSKALKAPKKSFGVQTNPINFSMPIKKTRFFSADEKKDAIRLLFVSRQAYQLLHKEKWLHLPTTRTVQRYIEAIF